jgi:hypothetical protein
MTLVGRGNVAWQGTAVRQVAAAPPELRGHLVNKNERSTEVLARSSRYCSVSQALGLHPGAKALRSLLLTGAERLVRQLHNRRL